MRYAEVPIRSARPWRWRAMALAVAVVFGLMIGDGSAAAPTPKAPKGVEAPPPPPPVAFRALFFADRPGDCDPVLARRGKCAEAVDFLPVGGDQSPRRSMRLALSAMYAELWQDIAYGWTAMGLDKRLGQTLPPAAEAFSRVAGRGRVTALPDGAERLEERDWIGPDAWFKPLRDTAPTGQARIPPSVRMAGRFALRMAYGGRLYDYDLMDADPGSSGPFFEQFFPYRRAREDTEGGWPLASFIWPGEPLAQAMEAHDYRRIREEMIGSILYTGGFEALQEREAASFESFYNFVGSRILANSLERYVPTHTRILTALVAMRRPPTRATELRRTADVVAAASGQTDKADLVEQRFDAATVLRSVDFVLHYDQLPPAVVDFWLGRFPGWRDPDPEFVHRMEGIYREVLAEYLRDQPYPLAGLGSADRAAWIRDNAAPGRSGDLDLPMRRIALKTLIEDVPRPTRDVWESRILLDHLSEAIAATFDPEGKAATPAAVERSATSQWTATLALHGLSPTYIDEGLGAVHPLAICTTLDKREALDEPAFRAINLDLLVDADTGAKAASEVLWSERARLPFIGVDNPTVAAPTLAAIIALPGGRSVYRIRWRVWTGWHLLWNSVPAGLDVADEERMVLRTGAVCDDTVLAPPELVPTLVRTALLAGDAFPVVPPTGRETRLEPPVPTNDEVVSTAQKTADKGPDQAVKTEEKAEEVSQKADVAVDVGGSALKSALEPGDKKEEEGDLPKRDEGLAWLRGVVEAPIRALVAAKASIFVFVLDSAPKGHHGWDLPARTPYARSNAAWGGRVAGWTWLLGPDGRSLVAPAYSPRPSVEAEADRPRWTRPSAHETTASVDAGFIPSRQVSWSCDSSAPGVAEGDTVQGCPAQADGSESQGLSADSAVLLTWWFHDAPRLALEAGPDLRLDIRPAGAAWSGDQPVYTWTFRPQLGIGAGIRIAARPFPLQSRSEVWCATRPDGGSNCARWEGGVRGALTVGPGFAGLEGNASAEGWLARSLSRPRSPNALLEPYWPDLFLGPYLRWQYAFPFGMAESRYLTLDASTLLSVGLRLQVEIGR